MDREWPSQTVAFGGVQREVSSYDSKHPLAPKLQRVYDTIEHDPKMDNRNVRKRNQKAVSQLMAGIRVMGGIAFNLAELYYNGAPGVAADWNKTLDMYVTALEAEDAETAFSRDWLSKLVFNMVGVVDSMELEGIEPVAERLDAACERACWRDLPEMKLAAIYGRARFAYLQSRRVQAVEHWMAVVKMHPMFQGRPLFLSYVEKAQHQVAKMQNTLARGGDEGMVEINARYQLGKDVLREAFEADPMYKSLSHTTYKEPDRFVFTASAKVPKGITAEEFAEEFRTRLNVGEDDFVPQLSIDPVKKCAVCGKRAYVEGKNMSKGSGKFKLSACSLCNEVLYCSTECQKQHWPQHKKECRGREKNHAGQSVSGTE